jgi:hypothetical protein
MFGHLTGRYRPVIHPRKLASLMMVQVIKVPESCQMRENSVGPYSKDLAMSEKQNESHPTEGNRVNYSD